jgi:hypothetical protein
MGSFINHQKFVQEGKKETGRKKEQHAERVLKIAK